MTNVATLQTAADLSASITAQGISSLVPAGVILAFGGATAPTGWLLCNGSAISRSTYADLFTAIGVAHGYGDNSTTFNLPDYRGRFIRGRDTMGTAASRDADRALRSAAATGGATGDAVGSVQGIATSVSSGTTNKSTTGLTATATNGGVDHQHTVFGGGSLSTVMNVAGSYIVGNLNSSTSSLSTAYLHTHGVSFASDNETRPLNAYVNYIIKI